MFSLLLLNKSIDKNLVKAHNSTSMKRCKIRAHIQHHNKVQNSPSEVERVYEIPTLSILKHTQKEKGGEKIITTKYNNQL